MKKLYFFCIALVALMLASCGGKDYREMLPADSFVIVSINPESLSRKAQVGDFTQSVYYKMAEQALADAPEEERGRILSLLAHPSETGLDVGSDVFMFVTMENASQTGNPTVGGLFKVGDRKKLDSFLGWLSQKSGFTSFEEDGITFLANTQGADMPVVAYDETALLVYTAPVDNDQAKAAAKKLFAQKKTESLMGNSQLAQAIERPSDMKFVMDYGSVMAVAGEQIGTAGLSGFEFLNKMSMAMPVDFEKGKIVAEARILFSDKEAEKQYMEMVAAQRKMDGDFLKMLPAENVATLAGSMDGTRTYEMLQKIPMYSMVFAMAPQVKPIMEAIDGDIALSFHGMTDNGRMPEAFADRGAEGSGDHGNDQRDDSRADAGDGSRPVCVEPGCQYDDLFRFERQYVLCDDRFRRPGIPDRSTDLCIRGRGRQTVPRLLRYDVCRFPGRAQPDREPDRTEPARSVGSRIAHGAFVVRYAGDHRPYGASGRACPEYDG